MKTLYLELHSGAAGDMLAAALLELVPDRDAALVRLNALGLPGVEIRASRASRGGMAGTLFDVLVEGETEMSCGSHDHVHDHDHGHMHHHAHTSLADVRTRIASLPVPVAACKTMI